MKISIFAIIALLTTSMTPQTLASGQNCPSCTQTLVQLNNSGKVISQRSAPPVVSIKNVYYQITGNSANQLRQQMNQRGPIDQNEKRHYDANASWYVRWWYWYSSSSNSCKITSTKVTVDVTFTLPKWNISPGTSPQLIAKWNRYLNALQVHENGHKDHGVAAANEIWRTLQKMPSFPTCQALEKSANSTAKQIINRYSRQDVDYDRQTQHGATQGAIFP